MRAGGTCSHGGPRGVYWLSLNDRSPDLTLQAKLNELFLRDQHLRGLRARLDAAGRRQAAQHKKLEQLQRQHDELKEETKRLQAKAANLEQDAAAAEEKVDRYRSQMNAVKTNKEYSALLVEVNTLKIEKKKIEDVVFEQMAKVEELQERLAVADGKVVEQQKLVDVAGKEVADARAEVGDRLHEVTAERDAAASALPPEVVTLFDKLCYEHDGEAVADIEVQDYRRKEYTCGGCFIALPIERISASVGKPNVITQCPNCRRILRVPDAMREKMQPK